ncbi:MAG: NUDIX domain-containing protein [Prevotellaceae bacterium]|jgi:ADP-ribose pyrophosphatase YjhB (NUDIX family)|nr:NUDIX domain-containing protein [Prevotellaceae bacterium]
MFEYKIFLDERFFLISTDEEKCFRSINGIGVRITDPKQINELFDWFEQSSILEFYACTEFPDDAFSCLKNNPSDKYVCAAGGVVINNNEEVLLIYRLGRWDLPKGKIEINETQIIAAQREIEEECGLSEIKIINKITDTYHVYKEDNKRIIKQTSWFKANYNGSQTLKPQTEEGITEARWIPIKDIAGYIPQMYASLQDLMTVVIQDFSK